MNYRFSPEAMEYLQSWQWPGNIRELQNCVEYFANWDQEEICLTDLLSLFGEDVPVKEKVSEDEAENEVEAKVWDYILHSRQEGYLSFLVLKLIAQKEGKSIGRRSLLEMPELRNTSCSEAKLRSILEELENYGFLDCARGRGGTSLTDEGRLVARYLQDHRIG